MKYFRNGSIINNNSFKQNFSKEKLISYNVWQYNTVNLGCLADYLQSYNDVVEIKNKLIIYRSHIYFCAN